MANSSKNLEILASIESALEETTSPTAKFLVLQVASEPFVLEKQILKEKQLVRDLMGLRNSKFVNRFLKNTKIIEKFIRVAKNSENKDIVSKELNMDPNGK